MCVSLCARVPLVISLSLSLSLSLSVCVSVCLYVCTCAFSHIRVFYVSLLVTLLIQTTTHTIFAYTVCSGVSSDNMRARGGGGGGGGGRGLVSVLVTIARFVVPHPPPPPPPPPPHTHQLLRKTPTPFHRLSHSFSQTLSRTCTITHGIFFSRTYTRSLCLRLKPPHSPLTILLALKYEMVIHQGRTSRTISVLKYVMVLDVRWWHSSTRWS
jgi:hypothetical protein